MFSCDKLFLIKVSMVLWFVVMVLIYMDSIFWRVHGRIRTNCRYGIDATTNWWATLTGMELSKLPSILFSCILGNSPKQMALLFLQEDRIRMKLNSLIEKIRIRHFVVSLISQEKLILSISVMREKCLLFQEVMDFFVYSKWI